MLDNRIFYGPHACHACGARICRASVAEGGEAFDYPEGPIYPNTVWVGHYCAPTPVVKTPTERYREALETIRDIERGADDSVATGMQYIAEEALRPRLGPVTH